MLVISDTGNVPNPLDRVSNLVQKLKSYINSIAAGEIKRVYPEKSAQDFVIVVECQREPTREMWCITRVMPPKDPAHTVRVRYAEAARGAWGPAVTGADQDDLASRKKTGPLAEPLDDLSKAALKRGVLVAEKYLNQEEMGFYFAVLGWDYNKTDVINFREDSVSDEVKREVDQYVRDLAAEYKVCVLVSVGQLETCRNGNREAVLLELHCRGQQMARLYAGRIRRKGAFLKHNMIEATELVGSRPGLLLF